jgi:hypothetical protein
MNNLPFRENNISENTFIREFKSDTDSSEYIWHKDKEDRIVESIGETDWLVQIDNELPKKIKGQLFIPKETYHRVIKGNGDLKIKLTKLL